MSASAPAAAAPDLWSSVLDHLACAVALYDADDRLVLCNADFRRVYPALAGSLRPGRRFEEMLREAVQSGLIPEAGDAPEAWIAARLAQHRAPAAPLTRRMADGSWRRITETRLPDGGLLAFSIDISELVETSGQVAAALDVARLATERLEDAIEALPVGFELWDADERLVLANSELARMYPLLGGGLEPGASFEALVRHNHAAGGLQVPAAELDAYIAGRRSRRRLPDVTTEHRTGEGRWIRTVEQPTRDGGSVGVRIDITDLVQREQQLAELNASLHEARARLELLAETDSLTGLANRRNFDRRLQEEWSRVLRHGMPLALLMVDVDHFKLYNDHYGHLAGDDCLRRIAGVLGVCARRPADLVARYGGEEFVLLLPHTDLDRAVAQAQRCLAALDEAGIEHAASPVAAQVTLSIGVAVAPARPGPDAQALIEAADGALYRAKAAGRHRVQCA